ncbi:MAG: EAL domain-containing protein, partial [Gammaproteobacteria bacterium]|nr:EAL domain-containing protein [Gammaproteobacteria bacterium]
EVKFITPDGYEDVYWSSGKTQNIKEDIADEAYFKEILNSTNIENTRVIFDENTQKYSLLISRSLVMRDDAVDALGAKPKARGVLAILLDLSNLNKEINNNSIGDSGYLSVVDSTGNILFTPDNITKSDAENNMRLLAENIPMEDSDTRSSIKVNDDIIFSYWRQLASGMNLIAFLPESDLINDSYELGKTVLVITFVVTFLVVLLVLLTLRLLIMRPIDALSFAVQEIGSGNLDIELDLNRNDEIGILSKSFYDMSKNLKQTHEEVNYIANHDSLTGLPNRVMFNGYLEKIIAIADTKKYQLSLLFIDLDNFKQINDTYGHQGGDILLKETAFRLNNSLRKNKSSTSSFQEQSCDMVSRIGGDEFIVLLDQIEGPWDATAVSDRILKILEKPVSINNEDVYISCSIGAAVYPDDASSAQMLIKNADVAMYHAKERGKNHYQFYSKKINTIMHDRLRIHSRLRRAIEDNQFFMNYQPQYDSITGEISGMEALIRWQDPDDGLVSPEIFIPIAEESGLISEITKWVMRNVCTQGMEWYSSGRLTVPIAVNISGIQFKRFDLLALITNCLETTGFPAGLLEVELTETSLLSETDHAIKIFTKLKSIGVSIALDDFGTGYSSLSYLNNLPIDTLKIDRSFVSEIKSSGDSSAIVDAIVAMGHALNLTIVAEGIETEIQRDYLKSKNCDSLQGYLLSRPLSVEDITLKLNAAVME